MLSTPTLNETNLVDCYVSSIALTSNSFDDYLNKIKIKSTAYFQVIKSGFTISLKNKILFYFEFKQRQYVPGQNGSHASYTQRRPWERGCATTKCCSAKPGSLSRRPSKSPTRVLCLGLERQVVLHATQTKKGYDRAIT